MPADYLERPARRGTIELLLQRREERPEALFLVTEQGGELTYAELTAHVERWAGHLATRGVGPGSLVAVMLRNHLDHVAAVFGLQWLGAVHVPISTHQRQAGLALQFETARPVGVLAESDYASDVAGAVADAGLDAFVEVRPAGVTGLVGWTDTLPDRPVPAFEYAGLDQPAMIAFTSGTTGRPKGAILPERFLMEAVRQAGILADLQPDDRLFMWEPLHHAPGWTTLRMALASGATIGMVDRFSASRCWQQIRTLDATKLHYLGGVINLLLKQPPSPDDRDHRVRIAWGGAAPRDSWRTFEERFDLTIREGYGLTEAANFAMLNLSGRVGSIGRPTDDMEAWIEDVETGARLPSGQVGQIVVRPLRPGITMLGYYGDPEASEAVLAGGVVRTGDLGYEEDGYFHFTGRATDSLRRRGENVSAWEVERVANEHPDVAESAVVGVPSQMGEDDIMMFVKPAVGAAVDEAALWAWLSERLAYYQVPRYLVLVEDFPYGPTQRIQKRLLDRSTAAAFDAETLTAATQQRRS